MNNRSLIEKFEEWREDDENEKIIAAVLALPENALDNDIMILLSEAYISIGEYRKAIAVLESLREKMDNTYAWHFHMGTALFACAENDEECENDEVLRRNILERAKIAFARGMNMNPPDNMLEAADSYMERLEEMLGIGEDEDEEDDDEDELDTYDDDELDAIEDHIKEYYGDFPTVFHELVSPDIHCDICIVPPTKERDYYTLLTMGMGARVMNIPSELSAEEYGRAELLICLPPEWKVGDNAEEWFWPIRLLKALARLPINCDTWLGWGHSVDNKDPFAENTELCGSLLVYPEDVETDAEVCTLPNGDKVRFFEVIPLYREEMDFKIDRDTHSLLEEMGDKVGHIVNIHRANVCEGYIPDRASVEPIDRVSDHSGKITDKNLPLELINGCNHIAIFLRWCIENKLIAREFYENCGDIVSGVLDGTQTDIREFITDYFDGALEVYQLNFMGANFANFYYNWDNRGQLFYPADVDACAKDYFGEEKYNCEEFQDEAYMFVPFDEDYYKNLSAYIDRAYKSFRDDFIDFQYKISTETAQKASAAFGFSAQPAKYPETIINDYERASEKSKADNTSALVMLINDENAAYTVDDLKSMLINSLDPYLEMVMNVTVPCPDPLQWAAEHFTDAAELAGDDMLGKLRKETCFRFGMVPWVLAYDSESSVLFIPKPDGGFIRMRGSTDEGGEQNGGTT